VGALVLLVLLIFRCLFSGSVRSSSDDPCWVSCSHACFRDLSGPLAPQVLDPSEFQLQKARSFAASSRIKW